MTTMNTNIENQICDAIQILAERAINQAPYDKTIPALIVECVDTKKGKYKVKYQDAFYYATSDNTELNYRKNTEVYILVPGNDFTKEKKILGTVKDMEDEYNDRMNDLLNSYYEVGKGITVENCGLCSYKHLDERIFEIEEIDDSFKLNIGKRDARLRISADIQTALPLGHRGKGTYGITAALRFTEEETGEPIIHTFTLDIDNMIGDPYNFGTSMRQSLDFEVNGSGFESVEYVKIYSKNFVGLDESKDDKEDNIFINNITITPLNNKAEGYVKIIAKDGYNLNQDYVELTFTAVPMLGTQEMKSENAKYYWFSEDSSIDETSNDETHTYYSPIGGKGWYWLNPESLTDTLTVTQEEQIAKKLKYLCVIVLDNEKYKETFEVINENAVNSVEIVSTNGTTEFIHDRGKTTLVCEITGGENLEEDFTYYWNKIDNSGVNIPLTHDNGDSQQILNQTSNLKARMELSEITYDDSTKNKKFNGNKNLLDRLGIPYQDSSNIPLSNEQVYNNVQSYLIENGLTCIINDTFFDVRAKNIITSAIYKCTVKNSIGKVVGVASIELRNIRLSQNNYTLKINNGTQIFKYDLNGGAPRDTSTEKILTPKALTVSLYDSKGNEIKEDYEIRWSVPTEKTLIEEIAKEEGADANFLPFKLRSLYNNRYVNNDIEVEVIYKGESIRATTDFTFIKEGFSGTNGTDYYCKIVPANGDFIDGYTFITYYQKDGSIYLNTNNERIELKESNPFTFTVCLYNNGIKVDNASDISWKLLDNNSKDTDFKPISIKNGILNLNTANLTDLNKVTGNYVGVIQAEVKYDNKKFFAELPIGLVVVNKEYDANYILEIKEGSGFNEVIYTSDGTNPQYNSGEHFTIYAAIEDNTGFKEDISHTLTTCEWTGKSNELTLKTGTDKNCNAIPIKQYDGLSSDIFIKCQTDIGTIFFPILFRLNRYGFSALNGWDGKGIKINEDENYILSPQIGAGKKDNKNRFTGVLMGVMKESNGNEDIGLLGFNEGERTIFLDSQTGKAEFGKIGAGQIIIDPSENRAIIQSGNYNTTNKTGMLIDLTTPEIKFGSGKFEVNSNGEIKSTAGNIGGWTINTTSISSQPEGKKLTLVQSQAGGDYAFVTGADSSAKVSEAPFYVKHDGTLKATKATIEGDITATSGSFTGTITAKEGSIGGWSIGENTLSSGKIVLDSSNNTIKAGDNFSVTQTGQVTAKDIAISGSGSTINGVAISNGTINNATITNGSISNLNIGSSMSIGGTSVSARTLTFVTDVNLYTAGTVFIKAVGGVRVSQDAISIKEVQSRDVTYEVFRSIGVTANRLSLYTLCSSWTPESSTTGNYLEGANGGSTLSDWKPVSKI